jgi:tetratricopeptide (TPR) repeat protein
MGVTSDIPAIVIGHALMLYAACHLAAMWAWGSKRGVSEGMLTVFGLAIPVGSWALSIAKPGALWAAPVSLVFLYFLAVRPRAELIEAMKVDRAADRASAEDRAISRPDDGSARLTLARVAEEEGRFDDALDHYEAAHRASDLMFPAAELASARDKVDALRAAADRKGGVFAHPIDAASVVASAALCFRAPVRGLAPLCAMLFVLWMRDDLGGE